MLESRGVGFTLGHERELRGSRACLRSSQFTGYPRGIKARRLGNDVMLRILDKLGLYIACILKMSKIITLFWNSEDDSTCMNLCHQGVLAEAKGLLIHLPSPPAPSSARKQMASSGFLERFLIAFRLPGRGFVPTSGWLSLKLKGKADKQSPPPFPPPSRRRRDQASGSLLWAW